jgi:hypothetical protein
LEKLNPILLRNGERALSKSSRVFLADLVLSKTAPQEVYDLFVEQYGTTVVDEAVDLDNLVKLVDWVKIIPDMNITGQRPGQESGLSNAATSFIEANAARRLVDQGAFLFILARRFRCVVRILNFILLN